MTKVLVLSYYYHPANFVACERVYSWAKYFNENDLYPIILTRQWNEGQTDIVDLVKNSNLKVKKYNGYEVHSLPYKNSFRDKLASQKKFIFIRKFLSLIEVLKDSLLFNFSRNRMFYKYSQELLNKEQEIKIVIASARPFFLFKVASLISNKNKVQWIADYRDEWTTIEPKPKLSIINYILFLLDRKNERKWIDSSSFFVTTSENIKNRITEKYRKKGFTIFNGYDGELIEQKLNTKYQSELNIVYAGTLYSYQDVGLLIDSVKKYNLKATSFHVKVTYVGVETLPSELNKLRIKINGNPAFKIIERLDYSELSKLYMDMDILYLTSYEQNIGWLPVKLFDYYKIGKPILLYPSDNGIMSDFISQSNSGISCSNHSEFSIFINKLRNNQLDLKRNESFGSIYSRRYQAKVFSQEIKNIFIHH